MSKFEESVEYILENEGVYSVDHAGPTKYGIILDVLKQEGEAGDIDRDGDVDYDDIRKLTIDDAKRVYRNQWWDRYGYHRFESQIIATKVFDTAVNMGPYQAHKILQRALCACGEKVTIDGKLGTLTLEASNRTPYTMLIAALRSEAAGVYRMIIQKHPDYQQFETGWLRRAYR